MNITNMTPIPKADRQIIPMTPSARTTRQTIQMMPIAKADRQTIQMTPSARITRQTIQMMPIAKATRHISQGHTQSRLLHRALSQCSQEIFSLDHVEKIIAVANAHKLRARATHHPLIIPTGTGGIPRPILVTEKGDSYVLMTHCRSAGDKALGQGGFKKTKLAVHIETGKESAVAIARQYKRDPSKTPNPRWNKTKLDLIQEGTMMQRCQDAGAVQLIAAGTSTPNFKGARYYMLMELCESGDLFGVLHNKSLKLDQKCQIASDLMIYVSRLHRKNLVHCDLKLENVFMKADGTCRLGDFGMCQPASRIQSTHGTPIYASPEIAPSWLGLQERYNTTQSDAWALGCILYELFHPQGNLFTPEGSKENVLLYIMRLDDRIIQEKLKELSPNCPQEFKLIIEGLLKVNPSERLSVDQANAILEKSHIEQHSTTKTQKVQTTEWF